MLQASNIIKNFPGVHALRDVSIEVRPNEVVGLIGERSREVADFMETKMFGEARKRSVVVAVPANHSPVLRIRGALRATAIAEAFRAEGRKVLLIMDSLTRVAHAGREIGLALGEPVTPEISRELLAMVRALDTVSSPAGNQLRTNSLAVPLLALLSTRDTSFAHYVRQWANGQAPEVDALLALRAGDTATAERIAKTFATPDSLRKPGVRFGTGSLRAITRAPAAMRILLRISSPKSASVPATSILGLDTKSTAPSSSASSVVSAP